MPQLGASEQLGAIASLRAPTTTGDGTSPKRWRSSVSIAMANARPEAKAAASRVSRWTNDEDAVAKEIWSLLEEERARRPWWRVW